MTLETLPALGKLPMTFMIAEGGGVTENGMCIITPEELERRIAHDELNNILGNPQRAISDANVPPKEW